MKPKPIEYRVAFVVGYFGVQLFFTLLTGSWSYDEMVELLSFQLPLLLNVSVLEDC